MITVREMQFWFKPELSEEEILEKSMIEIMVNLRQMKMTKEARDARQAYEQAEAERQRKIKEASKNK